MEKERLLCKNCFGTGEVMGKGLNKLKCPRCRGKRTEVGHLKYYGKEINEKGQN